MDDLIKLLKDRYTPIELVEVLDISLDDLIDALYPYLMENVDVFSDELKEYFE